MNEDLEDFLEPIWRSIRTPKGTLTIVFALLFLIAGAGVGFRAAAPHVLWAIAGACLVEVALVWRSRQVWIWPTSALLSGVIIAFVLGTEEHWYVTAALGALATVSKHAIKTRRGHIFNPAALALLLAVPIFGSGESWWGALAELPGWWIVVLIATGAFITDRVNKFPAVLAFTGVYYSLFTFDSLLNPRGVAEMFREPFVHAALFFAFFMLTDPPTSPGKLSEQLWCGALVGVVSVAAQLLGAGQTYLLIGLLAGNIALVARRWITTLSYQRKQKRQSSQKTHLSTGPFTVASRTTE